MAVHAHPDDESSKGAATMAKYVAEGVEVLVVTCTGGERGSVLNPKLDRPDVWANIADIRRAEMDAARGDPRRRAGLARLRRLRAARGRPAAAAARGLLRASRTSRSAAAPLVRLMREFRPHVVTTYDEEGGYPHPDHIMCHKVTRGGVRGGRRPGALPGAGRAVAAAEALLRHRLLQGQDHGAARGDARRRPRVAVRGVAEAVGATAPDKGERITTRVECADYFPVRDDALRAHATQVDPDGFWFQVPMELQQRAWPTEDLRAGPLAGRQPAARVRPLRRRARDGACPLTSGRGYAGSQPHIGGTPC